MSCFEIAVESGLSLIFFPQFGQKKSTSVIGARHEGQVFGGSMGLVYHGQVFIKEQTAGGIPRFKLVFDDCGELSFGDDIIPNADSAVFDDFGAEAASVLESAFEICLFARKLGGSLTGIAKLCSAEPCRANAELFADETVQVHSFDHDISSGFDRLESWG